MKKERLNSFSTGKFWTILTTSLLVLCFNMTGFSQCATGGFTPQFTGTSLSPGTFADPSLIPTPIAVSDDGAGGTGCVVNVSQTGVMSTNPPSPGPCDVYQISIEYQAMESDGSTDVATGILTAMIDPSTCVLQFAGDGTFTEQCLANAPPIPTAMDCAGNVLTVTETSNTNDGGSGDNGDPRVITRTYETTSACGAMATTTQTITIEDTTPPVANCANITAQLDAAGNTTITASDVGSGSTDNCNTTTLSVTPTMFTCANIGANTVTLTVNDNNGNTSQCTATVTVEDNVNPTAVCANTTVQLGAGNSASITAAQINNNSTDACGLGAISVAPNTFTCAELGANTVTLTVNDAQGNVATCTATVTVEEDTNPVAMCMGATLQLAANGMVTVMSTDIDNGSTDNCGTVNFSVSPSTLDCSNVGNNTVTLTVTDNDNNSDDCMAIVAVEDNVDPVAVCNNFTLQLDATGNGTLLPANVDASTDACGIANVSLSRTSFACADIGANVVAVTVTDNNGNTAMCNATVTVEDNAAPNAICQNMTIPLDAAGNASITNADVNNGSNDACGVASLTIDTNTFTCSEVGNNPVVLTVTDNHGNMATCTAMVTVEDNIDPDEICQNATVQLDAMGNGTIDPNALNNGSSDACGIASLEASPSMVTCANIGVIPVTLSVEDNSGNMETCTAMVTVEDNVNPTAICQNTAVVLDNSGNASIVAADLNNGSNDNCSAVTLSAAPTAFTCANLGTNTVVLSVEDAEGNIAMCNATVTVTENAPVVVDCPADIDVMTNGNCMIPVTYMEPSVAGCAYSLQSQTHASGDMFPQGTTMVEYVFSDGTNTLMCNFNVTITDMGAGSAPMLNCGSLTAGIASNTTGGKCGADGFNLTPVMQTDDCGAGNLTLTYTISGQTTASGTGIIPNTQAFNIGVSTIDYVLTDNSGNTDDCSFTITINDAEMPTLDCSTYQPSVNADVDANTCTASNLTLTVNPTDNCGVTNLTYQLSGATTAMSSNTGINDASDESYNAGTTMVTYSASDANGNAVQCNFNVVITDNEDPMITCPAPAVLMVSTNPGTCGFTQSGTTFNPTFSDNCPNATIENDRTDTNTLMGEIFPIGTTTVVWTATDNAGNEAMCTINIIVTDNEDPMASCANMTVQLNASGNASITGADIDGGSTDNCGIMSLTTNPITFNCSNVGDNNVILTVTDDSGNTDNCIAVVTVEDNIDPVATCMGGIPLTLNAAGTVSIADNALDNGSSDACGIASFVASQTTFTCDDVGNNMVTLTVTDNNGNTATCITFIGVSDNTAPNPICQNTMVQLDASGNATVMASAVDNGSSDACDVAILAVSPNTFTCAEVGDNNVTLTVTDVNGNSSTCMATVTVQDTENPTAICQNATIQLDVDGDASIAANQIDNGSNDNCGSVTLSVSPNVFDCSNLGTNTVTLTVTDDDSNTATCNATVTVEDNIDPVAMCQNQTIQLDADGTVTLNPELVNNNSSDACGLNNLSVSPNMFTCTDIGTTNVTLSLMDPAGNSASCNATVTIEDSTNPIAMCQNISVDLDGTGDATITAMQIDNGSTDACGIMSRTLDIFTFDCTDTGNNTVVLTVTDNNGNTATCNATVVVNDDEDPMALCQNISVGIGASGDVTIMASQVDNGSSDNCNMLTLTVSQSTFTCDNIGNNTVTLTATDASGNDDTCTATVTVVDSAAPIAACMNATIQLDAMGNAMLTPAQVDGGSSVPCGSMSFSVSPNTFTCTNSGANTVTLTVTHNGMTDDCTATVTVEDNVDPTPMCQDITIQLDNAGDASITTAQIDNGSTDACGITQFALSQMDFTCIDIGEMTVTLSVRDGSGNTSTCNANVDVLASSACAAPTITNMGGPNIADPCLCIGNGRFSEEVVIETMGTGHMWTVQSTTLIDPNTGNPYPAGTPFVEQAPMGGMVKYTLEGIHLDGQGYMLSATSPFFPGVVMEITNTCYYADPVIVTDLSSGICMGTPAITLEGNGGLMSNSNPIAGTGEFSINGNVVTEIDPAVLGTGTFTLVFTFDAGTAGSMNQDDPGCEETIMTTFTVEETPVFQGCNNEVTVILGPTCEAFITADVILEGDFTCVDDYEVTLFSETGQAISNPITGTYLGQTLTGTVTHVPSGNFCSSQLIIEDSIEPTIHCQPITVTCMDALPPFGTGVTGMDNCDANPDEILLNETYNTDDSCTDATPGDGVAGFVTVTRMYIAEDASGMQSQPCSQVITITRPDDVDFPDDLYWTCDQYNANPNIIDAATLHPSISAGFGAEFPIGANGFGWDLSSMATDDPRMTNNVPNSDPARPTGSGRPNVDTGNFCNYSVTSSDDVLGICGFGNSTDSPTFKIFRTWSVLDWCTGDIVITNNAGEDNVQFIVVMDDQGPSIMGMDVTIPTNIPANGINPATANGVIPAPTATDNCTSVDEIQGNIYSDAGLLNSIASINANGTFSPSLPVGSYFIGHSATDVCGNVNQSVAYNLEIVDTNIPTMICDEITEVNVPSTGIATVPANVFDDGSFDECGMVTFAVRRMNNDCSVAGSTAFGPTVTFCCADVTNSPVNVVLQATDCDNNTNTCMIIVNVGDKIDPTVTCPPNATIDCDEYEATLRIPLELCNMDDNCESTALSNAGYGDVIVNDNCTATAQPTVNISMDNCGNGSVTRSFIATDASNNQSTVCVQTISIYHASDWVVEFDPDVTLDCGATTMNVTDAFDEPEIFFETCEMIATSFTDATFTQVNDACFKVVRTWKVINWCVVGNDIDQEIDAIELSETALGEDLNNDGVLNTRTFQDSYRGTLPTSDNDVDADNQDGFITYIQTVKVIDDEAPIFAAGCNIPDVCITGTTCGTTVNLPTPTVTDCVDASFINITVTSDLGNGFTFNNVMPGTYNVTYQATDNCGNIAPCSNTVTVNDCKLPSPVCVDDLVVELMATNDPNNPGFEPMVEILPSMIDAGSSDNCPLAVGGLKLSFSPSVGDVSRIFTCDSVGERTVRLYVTDGNNLQDYCEIQVEVQANQGQCGPPLLIATVAGNLATEDVADVENVMVYINGTNNVAMNYMTDAAGIYDMDVPMGGDYTVAPVKDDNHGNGVTTFDLVKISKHILNIQALDSPYKMIAADANNSQSITTLDLVHIRKLILQVDPQFTNNTSWRFVDGNYVFPNPSNPWFEEFPEVISINNLGDDQLEEDFVAIKIGDVNNTATANQLLSADDRTETGALNLMTKNVTMTAGETYAITMNAANFNHFGYQFTLKFDTDKLAFERIENGLATADNFGTTMSDDGFLTTSWNRAIAIQLAADAAMFTLHFTALADGQLADALKLSDNFTTAEAYAANGDLETVDLQFNSTIATDAFALYQNQPNPFSEMTTIGFYLPTAQEATLTVSDLSGKTVYALTQDFELGRQEITLTHEQIGVSGVLYYRLETADGAAVRKMVIE